MDIVETTEALDNLASAAEAWTRLGHTDLADRLKTVAVALLEEHAAGPKPRHRK